MMPKTRRKRTGMIRANSTADAPRSGGRGVVRRARASHGVSFLQRETLRCSDRMCQYVGGAVLRRPADPDGRETVVARVWRRHGPSARLPASAPLRTPVCDDSGGISLLTAWKRVDAGEGTRTRRRRRPGARGDARHRPAQRRARGLARRRRRGRRSRRSATTGPTSSCSTSCFRASTAWRCAAASGPSPACRSSCSPRGPTRSTSSSGLESGADDYIMKPFKPQELIARVRARLRRGDEPEPEQLEIGDLHIDVAGHSVKREGSAAVAHPAGVRPAGRPRPQAVAGLHPRGPARAGLGLPARRRHPAGQRPRPAAAQQDREGPRAPRDRRDGPGRRLQGRPELAMTERRSGPDHERLVGRRRRGSPTPVGPGRRADAAFLGRTSTVRARRAAGRLVAAPVAGPCSSASSR